MLLLGGCCLSALNMVDRDSAPDPPKPHTRPPSLDHILPRNRPACPGACPHILPPTRMIAGLELQSPVSQSLVFFYFFFREEFSQGLTFLVSVTTPLAWFLPASYSAAPDCWHLSRMDRLWGSSPPANKSHRWHCRLQVSPVGNTQGDIQGQFEKAPR